MAIPTDSRNPNVALDYDTEQRLLPPNHYTYGKNGRSGTSDKDSVGAVEGIRGNKSVASPVGLNEIVIGSAQDTKNNAVIEFVHNTVATTQITYGAASMISYTPPSTEILNITNTSIPLSLGMTIKVTQGTHGYIIGLITNISGTQYTLSYLVGTNIGDTSHAVTEVDILGNDYIRRYFVDAGTTEFLTNPALMGVILNFSLAHKIINPRVIEAGFTQLLAWTDGYNMPRLMDIDKMKAAGVYYGIAADEQYINLKKTPPSKPPTFGYTTVSGGGYNLINKNFQFRYRFVFDDFSYSEFSPISYLTLNPATTYNNINVNVYSGHHTVIKVEVSYREGNGVSATGTVNPNWYSFIIAIKSQLAWADNTYYDVAFVNDTSLIVNIPSQLDTDTNVTDVPQIADHIEVISTNEFGEQIVLSPYTSGEDNVQIDSSGSSVTSRAGNNDIPMYFFPITPTSANVVTIDFSVAWGLSGQPIVGSVLVFRIQNPVSFIGDNVYVSITDNSTLAKIALEITPIIAAYSAFFGTGLVSCVASGSNIVITFNGAGTHPLLSSAFWSIWTSPFITPDNLTQDVINVNQTNKTYPDVYMPTGGPALVYFDMVWSDAGDFVKYGSWDGTTFKASMNISFLSTVAINIFGTVPALKEIDRVYVEWSINGANSREVYTTVTWTGAGTYSTLLTPQQTTINLQKDDTLKIRVGFRTGAGDNYNVTNVHVTGGSFVATAIIVKNIPQIGFKKYNKYDIGIVYQDGKLYQGGVNLAMKSVYFPGILDNSITPLTAYIPKLLLHISNAPPSWATQYSIVIKNNELFQQAFVTAITYDANGNPQLAVSNLQSPPAVGDFVRLIFGVEGSELPNPMGTDVVFPVLGYSASTGILISDINGSNVISPSSVIEIFRPVVNTLYFENGQFFDLVTDVNGNKVHAGTVQNQIIGAGVRPAIIDVLGDTWYQFNVAGNQYYLVETQQLFPNGDTAWNKGRTQVETPNQRKQKYINFGKWSGALINNTQVNDLNVWDDGNYFEVNATKGNITGLRQIGYTLTILQQANINKTFLGRRQVSNADGSSQLVVTDNLISTINPSEDGFGTKHPGSVCVNGDNLYFWDTLRGKLCCSGTNGVRPDLGQFAGQYAVADIRAKSTMSRYFRDKSAVINSSANYEIISGVDEKYGDIYFTVRNANDNTEETIYFNEGQQFWKYFVDMESTINETKKIIDWYGWVGQSFFTFMRGEIWQQGVLLDGSSKPKYLTLFGEQKSLVVETIGMMDADKVKIFMTHSIRSNIAPTLVEFWIPPNAMYPNGMYSKLFPGNYSYREGVFYASIKKDWFTKGIPGNDAAGNLQIATGRQMRGHVVKVRLTYTTSSYVELFSEGVGMIPSELS